MKTAAHTLSHLRHPLRPETLPLTLGLVACLTVFATYALGARWQERHDTRDEPATEAPHVVVPAAPHVAKPAAPTASEFAEILAGTANGFAQVNGAQERLTLIHCVSPSSGHYMCSYAIARPGQPAECHLMQAEWTPDGASSYTVTLSGRTDRCSTLREAVRSLR